MKTTASIDEVYRVIFNDHHDPFAVLGPHLIDGGRLAIRAFLPGAETVSVIAGGGELSGKEIPMEKVHELGFFEVVIPGVPRGLPLRTQKDAFRGA